MDESKKRAVTIFTIVLSLVPIPFIVHYPNGGSLRIVSLYAAAVVGYMGVVFMLWMYMLGTRSVSTFIFKDIAPILSIHKWLGKYATPMIFAHPILITYSRGEAWFYSLIPQFATKSERHILLGQIAILLLLITWFVSAYLRERIGFRPWKYIHYLAYICVPFALLHIPDLGSQEQTFPLVKFYYFLLVLVFMIFSILRLRSLFNLDRKEYVISSNSQLTDIDRQLIVRPRASSLMPPRMGQYVYIKLGYISEDHPFSVTWYDKDTGSITLTYRSAGMYTKELAKLLEGAVVYMKGPFGTFTHEIGAEIPVVYIAGGIGVTPFISRILNESNKREQWMFLANRTKATAVLSTTLKTVLHDRHIAFYNQEKNELGPNEEKGYINADGLRKYLTDPLKYHYYICGPVPMMVAVRKELASLGVQEDAIFTERFGW
jgi:predicted ferric reductase